MKEYLFSAALFFTCTAVHANSVSIDPINLTVSPGDTFTLNIFGTGFVDGIDGGGLNIAFDPNVLQAGDTGNTSLPAVQLDPAWEFFTDAGAVDNTAGRISDIGFATFNDLPPDFNIGRVLFTAVGLGPTSVQLSESLALGGFARLGTKLDVTFSGSQVQVSVVPIPAAIWLFSSGIFVLLYGRRSTRKVI